MVCAPLWLLDACNLLLVVRVKNYDLNCNLRGAITRNNERNTLLLRAFAIWDKPLYDLKLIGLLVKSNLWFVVIE